MLHPCHEKQAFFSILFSPFDGGRRNIRNRVLKLRPLVEHPHSIQDCTHTAPLTAGCPDHVHWCGLCTARHKAIHFFSGSSYFVKKVFAPVLIISLSRCHFFTMTFQTLKQRFHISLFTRQNIHKSFGLSPSNTLLDMSLC